MNDLFNEQEAESCPVECLGQTFPSDQARRAHYLNRLEVLRAGFKHAWANKDFSTILAVAKKKDP